MSELWGPPTESYKKVLAARVHFLGKGSNASLQYAQNLFLEAVQSNDLFARWELSYCHAHPKRIINDTEVSDALAYRPTDWKERAAMGYFLPLSLLAHPDNKKIWSVLPRITKRLYVMCIPALWNLVEKMLPDHVDLWNCLRLLVIHFHVPAVHKYVNCVERSKTVPRSALVSVGRLFQACRDSGNAIEMPLQWHANDTFQYGRSDFTRFRLHSTSPALICVQSDNACRRAVLYWMWAPLPVVKDVKRMIAQKVWESRYELSVWVRTRMIAPEKRLKA